MTRHHPRPATPFPAAAMTGSSVIRAVPADLDTLSQLIADAFRDLAPSRWLIADQATRRKILPGYFRIYVEHALEEGVAYTTTDRAAAALWMPFGSDASAPPAGYGQRLAAATGPWASRFQAFDVALEARHPAGLTHHHLALLAVRPGRQGQGIGTTLLRRHHQILDRDGVPAYLEASSLRTRALYLRHGYADHGSPIYLPDGPLMYPLLRPPRTAA
jgi:ribosomal protein S18 acetylase RimI-like enzyme